MLRSSWSHQQRGDRAVRLGVWHGDHGFEDRTGIECVGSGDGSGSVWLLARAGVVG